MKREIEDLQQKLEEHAASEKQECASSESSVKEEEEASSDLPASVKDETLSIKKEGSGDENEVCCTSYYLSLSYFILKLAF